MRRGWPQSGKLPEPWVILISNFSSIASLWLCSREWLRGRSCRAPLLLVLVMTLSGCATPPPASRPQIPALPAALTTDDSADSLAYSQRVQAWLKKVADELSSWQPRKPGCSETRPASGACL